MDRRSYNQFCGLARSLDLVGERWTLLVVRNLLLGPLRYSELMRGLPGITTNLLAKRLREMEELGLIEHTRSTAGDGGHSYRLTPLGAALEPAIHALGHWGWQAMKEQKKGERRSLEWLLVALRRRYLGGTTLRAELVADDVPYRMILSEKSAEIARGEVSAPDIRIRGTGAALSKLFVDPPPRMKIPDDVEIEGTSADFKTLLGAFAVGEIL